MNSNMALVSSWMNADHEQTKKFPAKEIYYYYSEFCFLLISSLTMKFIEFSIAQFHSFENFIKKVYSKFKLV